MRLADDEFALLVEEALADIPPAFAKYMEDISVDVESIPDQRTCAEAGIDDPADLLGFYRGTPLTQRSIEHDCGIPDRITIYQRNLERMCRTRSQMIRQIRRTVFHEVGHHFGLDEDDLERLGYA